MFGFIYGVPVSFIWLLMSVTLLSLTDFNEPINTYRHVPSVLGGDFFRYLFATLSLFWAFVFFGTLVYVVAIKIWKK